MLYVSVSSARVFQGGFLKCEMISGYLEGEWRGLKYVFVFDMSEKSDEPLSSNNMPQEVAGKPNASNFVLNSNKSVYSTRDCIEACLEGQQVHCVLAGVTFKSQDYS